MKNKILTGAALAAVLFSCTISGALTGCSLRRHPGSDLDSTEAIASSLSGSHSIHYGNDSLWETAYNATEPYDLTSGETAPEEQTEVLPGTGAEVPVSDAGSTGKGEESGNTGAESGETQKNTVSEEQSATDSAPDETDVHQVVTPSDTTSHGPDTNFTISTITYVNKASNDYYYELVNRKGYVPVKNTDELRDFCVNKVLSLDSGVKNVMYIIAPSGAFDGIIGGLNTVSSVAGASPTAANIYKKESYLYNELGLDYQYYYARGMAVFMMQNAGSIKLKDAGYSLYAVYYYSYQTKEQVQAVKDKAESLTLEFTGSTYDRILAAYDYLKDNVSYSQNINDIASHTAYSAFYNGSAVCEGYAKAYKIMLDSMGIPNEIVENPTHAWNMVQCDDEWYFIDVTNGSVNECYMYFMLGKDVLESECALDIFDRDKPTMYFVFTKEDIAYYGYTDGTNTASHPLASQSRQKIQVHQ